MINLSSGLINDEQPGTGFGPRPVRRIAEIGHLIAHARFHDDAAAVFQLTRQLAFENIQNMPPVTPMIGKIAGRILNNPDTDIADV